MNTHTLERPPSLRDGTSQQWCLHRGWAILVASALTVYMSAPGQSFSVAAFIDPMLTGLGMLRSEYSAAYLVATLVGGCALPWVGRLLDARGARAILPIVAIGLTFACWWMSQVQTLASLYIGFTLLRSLGQGSLTLISGWMVGEWFSRRRGLATGVVGLGGTLSVMTVPQINEFLIGAHGWRSAWIVLGIAVAVALVIPARLLVRNRPEDVGLLPDLQFGESSDGGPAEKQTAFVNHEESWTSAEAVRTTAFWKLQGVICTVSMIGTGLVFHQVSVLGDHGVSRSSALWLLAAQATVGTLSSLVAGYLSDRWHVRYLLSLSMWLLAAAMLLVMLMPSPAWSLLYAVLLGLQGGIIRSTGTVVWINYFGRQHQGSVRGLAMSMMVVAAAFGPLPLALSKDHWHSYDGALMLLLVLPVAAGLAVLSAHPPRKNPPGDARPHSGPSTVNS